MASVVFLRAVNVGTANRCRPAEIAKKLARFEVVNVLHGPLRKRPALPLALPSDEDWLAKVVAIHGRYVLGVYRREMKAIGCLGKIEKLLGVPITNRNWNTMEKVVTILKGA